MDEFENMTEDEQWDESVSLLYPNADPEEVEEELMSNHNDLIDFFKKL